MPHGGESRIKLPILADLIMRNDGTWAMKPTMPDSTDLDTWVRIRDAATILGVSTREVYRMAGVYLVIRKPTPSRMLVSLNSVRRLKQASNDSEFWKDGRKVAAIRIQVEREMVDLARSAVQAVGQVPRESEMVRDRERMPHSARGVKAEK